MTLTRRGRVVLALLILTALVLITPHVGTDCYRTVITGL